MAPFRGGRAGGRGLLRLLFSLPAATRPRGLPLIFLAAPQQRFIAALKIGCVQTLRGSAWKPGLQ